MSTGPLPYCTMHGFICKYILFLDACISLFQTRRGRFWGLFFLTCPLEKGAPIIPTQWWWWRSLLNMWKAARNPLKLFMTVIIYPAAVWSKRITGRVTTHSPVTVIGQLALFCLNVLTWVFFFVLFKKKRGITDIRWRHRLICIRKVSLT